MMMEKKMKKKKVMMMKKKTMMMMKKMMMMMKKMMMMNLMQGYIGRAQFHWALRQSVLNILSSQCCLERLIYISTGRPSSSSILLSIEWPEITLLSLQLRHRQSSCLVTVAMF
jgi:hypothetical protein